LSLNLIQSTKNILHLAEDVSHKNFQFIEKVDIDYFARVKPARKNMPFHLIFYKSEHNEIINHLVAHECGHIIRMFAVPEEQRLIPKTSNEIKKNALTGIEDDINRLSSLMSFNQLAQIVNMWYSGTINQVTNQPPDIMIEKWIYDDYPDLRELQLQSLKKQHDESVIGLTTRVARMTPRKIYEVSNIMNYCFFKYLGLYLNTDYLKPYWDFKYKRKGEELARITQDYKNDYPGDMGMIKKWAEYLGIANWFVWTDFENVPPDYQNML
jgi:hypothetical protein